MLKAGMFAWSRWAWLCSTWARWSLTLHLELRWSSVVTSTPLQAQVTGQRSGRSMSGHQKQNWSAGLSLISRLQVWSSCSARRRFLRSTRTGAARVRKSPAACRWAPPSRRCRAPAGSRPTPTMWEDFTAAWTTSSSSRRACRYLHGFPGFKIIIFIITRIWPDYFSPTGGAGDSSAQPPGGHHPQGSAQRGSPLRPHRAGLRPPMELVTSDLFIKML